MATEAVARDTVSLASIKTVNDAANESKTLLGDMRQAATDAGTTLTEIYQDAKDAETAAGEAKTSAASAQNSANGALKGLSTVQDVIGVLDWAKNNATYTLTSDTDIVPGKTYWTRSGSGTEADPYTYTPVVTPAKADLGTYYEISGVDEAMADYINTHLALTDEGLWIIPDAGGNKVLIATGQGNTYTTAGTYIVGSGGEVLAKFAENEIVVGKNDNTEAYLKLDYRSLQLIDKEGDDRFVVKDLRNEQGVATITEEFIGDGKTKYFYVGAFIHDFISATVNGALVTPFHAMNYGVGFSPAPQNEASIIITYTTKSSEAWMATIGERASGHEGTSSVAIGQNVIASGATSQAFGLGAVASGGASHAEGRVITLNGVKYFPTASGMGSHCEGLGTKASGEGSHAQGRTTVASGTFSHAEGDGTTASEDCSHAEGVGTTASDIASHAEGCETTANGAYSHVEGEYSEATGTATHAEGYATKASGQFSHSQNMGTIASKDSQTAIGRYNEEDNEKGLAQKAFIIGNGTSDTNRSNGFTVDWNGNTEMQGRATTADMTTEEITAFIDELRGVTS